MLGPLRLEWECWGLESLCQGDERVTKPAPLVVLTTSLDCHRRVVHVLRFGQVLTVVGVHVGGDVDAVHSVECGNGRVEHHDLVTSENGY